MPQRVAVFLDWQNVYMRGRAAFGDGSEHHTFGQVDPLSLAMDLCSRKPDRKLAQVRIYRGIPTNKADPKGYAATRRQTAAWMARDSSRTHVFLRPIQYLDGMAPREKGIDVQLAVDFVTMAVRGEYDVGILFSQDSDLNPAVEALCEVNVAATAEVAAWRGVEPRRIAARTTPPTWCHWVNETIFTMVSDPTDYGLPAKHDR